MILVGASDVLRWLEEGAPPSPSSAPRHVGAVPLPSRGAVRLDAADARRSWSCCVGAAPRAASGAGAPAGRQVDRQRAGDARRREGHSLDDARSGADAATTSTRVSARSCSGRKAHADRVVVVRQSWFDKDAADGRGDRPHMWHGGVGQAWREERDDVLLDRRDVAAHGAARRARRARRGGDSASSRSISVRILEPSLDHLLRLLPPHAVGRAGGRRGGRANAGAGSRMDSRARRSVSPRCVA